MTDVEPHPDVARATGASPQRSELLPDPRQSGATRAQSGAGEPPHGPTEGGGGTPLLAVEAWTALLTAPPGVHGRHVGKRDSEGPAPVVTVRTGSETTHLRHPATARWSEAETAWSLEAVSMPARSDTAPVGDHPEAPRPPQPETVTGTNSGRAAPTTEPTQTANGAASLAKPKAHRSLRAALTVSAGRTVRARPATALRGLVPGAAGVAGSAAVAGSPSAGASKASLASPPPPKTAALAPAVHIGTHRGSPAPRQPTRRALPLVGVLVAVAAGLVLAGWIAMHFGVSVRRPISAGAILAAYGVLTVVVARLALRRAALPRLAVETAGVLCAAAGAEVLCFADVEALAGGLFGIFLISACLAMYAAEQGAQFAWVAGLTALAVPPTSVAILTGRTVAGIGVGCAILAILVGAALLGGREGNIKESAEPASAGASPDASPTGGRHRAAK